MSNKTKTVYPLSLILLLAQVLIAQKPVNWREKGDNKTASFYEVQQDFNEYWQSKTPQKGQGYKVFKRWENFMAPRVYPSGDMRLPSMAYENFMSWKNDMPKTQNAYSPPSNWMPLGPLTIPNGYDAASGRVDFVRFDPTNNNIIYVGAPDGGLWKSTNGGTTWTTNTDFLPIIGCSDIVIDPTNTQIMYLATGNWENDRKSIGILKSTNGGASWSPTSLAWSATDNHEIRRLIMHPSNPLIMMAATESGIFRTEDGWATNSNDYCCNTVYDIEFKPTDPGIVYACGKDYWKSSDGGATWTVITTGLPAESTVSRMMMAVTAADPAYVYIIAGNISEGYRGTYRSTDSGNSFSLQSSTPNILGYDKVNPGGSSGQASHDLAIAVSPTNADLVTIGGINAWQSTDGGVTWTCVAYWAGTDPAYPGNGDGPPDYVHADVQDIQYLPGSSTTLFATADGGIYKSVNNGGNWTKLSGNLAIGQQTGVALSASSPTLLVCGEQDIGNLILNGSTWSRIGGGDGEDAFIHRNDNNIVVTSDPYGSHEISFDGGVNRTAILGLPGGAEWFSPISQDPVVPSTVYAGGRPALYRKTDLFTNNNGTWETLGTPPGTGNIRRFVVAPSNNSIIYAIKSNAVSKSTNAGSTWTDITGTLPVSNASLSNIAISNTDPNKVWVSFSGYSAGNKVFKTTNGGTSWSNLSSGLPNLPINTIVHVNNSSNDELYLGGDIGVYYIDNTASVWAIFNTGLPNAAVTDLEIYYPGSKLRASTYGRGTWETSIQLTTFSVNWSFGPVAKIENKHTYLTWGVASQFNNEKFAVEHSTDGRPFQEVGIVAGDGNLATSKEYQFIHDNPRPGANYYRIKQIDFNGQYQYSKVVQASFELGKIAISPNPSAGIINLSFNKDATVLFTDLYGRTLKKIEITKGINTIDISELQKGIYFLKIENQIEVFLKI